MRPIAERHGLTALQLACAWNLAHEPVATVAPTLVGGSYGRGGGDLGPRGSKHAWVRMGINGNALGDEVPGPDGKQESDKSGSPHKKLTVQQAALLQAFPPEWSFAGAKTNRYRQIGQASPPPVAEALGRAVAAALAS